jgi:hypothetical protein
MASRFEAADTRLTAFLTLAATLTLGTPLFAKTIRTDISFQSWWFRVGLACFVISTVIGIVGRVRGGLMLVDPGAIFQKHLHASQWEFRKNLLYLAGQDFNHNAEAIRRKGNLAVAVTALLATEVFVFVVWIAR